MGIEETLNKILAILEKMDGKLDSLSSRMAQVSAGGTPAPSAAGTEGGAGRRPSDIALEQEMSKETNITPEGRVKCPHCDSVEYGERDDKSKPIAYRGSIAIFAKIRYCKKCGSEF